MLQPTLTLTLDTIATYWEQRIAASDTPWDIGYASPALVHHFDQLLSKNIKILIPGCGAAHEARWLLANGFNDITLLDIAPTACQQLHTKLGETCRIINQDFFQHQGNYDLIVEQTFFCALPNNLRTQYAAKMNTLLNENGTLVGLLFDTQFEKKGPPFGGNMAEYMVLFQPYFNEINIAPCSLSIAPRANTELWITLKSPKKI